MELTDRELPACGTASAAQGWALSSANWLAAVATAVLAPVLPRIAQEFHAEPHVGLLVSLLATMPALFVAAGAWPAGLLADRFGMRRLLLIGVGIYGFAGCAPMVLNSLPWIVVTRMGVGMTEAVIMTCSTALVADYFQGDDREKWLAVQTGGGGVVAVAMIALGGALGEASWRMPFAMYGVAFLLFPLCLTKTWEPKRQRGFGELVSTQQLSAGKSARADRYKWTPLFLISLLTFFASTAFYFLIIQLSFLLSERGVTSPGKVGLGCAAAVLFGPIGAVLFKVLRLPVQGKLALSFALLAAGFYLVAFSRGFLATVIGAAINQLGAGMVLPTLITWALSKLTLETRARGTGVWQSAIFAGQFLSPLIVLFLKNSLGSLSSAVEVYGGACAVAAAVAMVAGLGRGARNTVNDL